MAGMGDRRRGRKVVDRPHGWISKSGDMGGPMAGEVGR